MSFNSSQHTALDDHGGTVDVLDPGHLAAGAEIDLKQGPALVWIARGAIKLEWRTLHGSWRPLLLRDGDFYLSMSELVQLRRAHQCQSDFEGIRLHISRNVVHRCANDSGATAWQGHEITGTADPTLRSLLELLGPVRSRSTSLSTPFIDGIAQAVIARLMSYPAGAPREQECNSHGLAPFKFRLVSRVMRERLTEPFDLEHLAGR